MCKPKKPRPKSIFLDFPSEASAFLSSLSVSELQSVISVFQKFLEHFSCSYEFTNINDLIQELRYWRVGSVSIDFSGRVLLSFLPFDGKYIK